MDYNLEFERKDEILWVTASGTRSLKSVLAVTKDVLNACKEHDLNKVLVDVRPFLGRLSTKSSFSIPTKFFPKLRDPLILSQVAIIDLKEFELSYRFFENLAVKRGMKLKIFSNLDLAVAWLQRE